MKNEILFACKALRVATNELYILLYNYYGNVKLFLKIK